MKKEILTLVFAIIPGMQVTAEWTITVVVNPVVHTEAYQGHTSVFQVCNLLFQIFKKLDIYMSFLSWNRRKKNDRRACIFTEDTGRQTDKSWITSCKDIFS